MFDPRGFALPLLRRGLLGAALGALVLGVGGRLAMRVVGLALGQPIGFTVEGSLTVVAMGALAGAAGTLLHAIANAVATRVGGGAIVRLGLFAALLALATLRGLRGSPGPAWPFWLTIAAYGIALEAALLRCRLRRTAGERIVGTHSDPFPRRSENAMRTPRFAAIVTMLLGAGCADVPSAPGTPSLAASPARQVQASGTFVASVDFTSFTFTPRGRNCLLTVKGQLDFSGTIVGTAVGQTSAHVFAPCDQVATTPPGTFRDVFRSELAFTGTVDGVPARATVYYMGGVAPGGAIDGRLVFSHGDVRGELDADAVVAVGGSYSGSVVVR